MEEKLRIRNRSDLKLAAIIHKSPNPAPGVIVLHGNTGFKEEQHIEALAVSLHAKGMTAIRFDTSGFGESEGSTEKDFRVSNYLNDIEDVYQWLLTERCVDPARIGMCGHSLGGSLAVIFSALHPQIKACCPISAPTKLTRAGRPELAEWKRTGWREKQCDPPLNKLVRIPWAMAEDADRWDALSYAGNVRCPTLTIIGAADTTVDPLNTMLIYESLPEPKQLLRIEGVDHFYKCSPGKTKEVTDYAVDFFVRALGGSCQSLN